LEDFESIPSIFKDEVFTQAFEKAEIANYNIAEFDRYQASLKVFRDNKAVYDYAVETAFDDGKTEGLIEGKLGIAKALKENGVRMEIIIKTTGLSESEIDKL
jgi:predicted transposase/invertase (TIGR01784 family)